MSVSRDPFGARVAEAQDRWLHQSPVHGEVRRRLLAGEGPRRRRGAWGPRVAGAAAVAAAAAAAWWFLGTADGPRDLTARRGDVAVRQGAWIDASDAPARIDFSDGTRVVFGEGSSARVARLDARGADLLLERGRADLDVVHTGDAAWTVRAGPYTVHVTGTAFEVRWDPAAEAFALQMREGSVEITGPGPDDRRVVGGTDLFVGPNRIAAGPPPHAPAAAPTAAPVAPAPPPRAAAPPGRAEAPEDWYAAYLDRDYARAVELVRDRGVDAVVQAETADRLFGLGDAAGLQGARDLEARAWRALRDRFPGTGEAAAAAWKLGLLAERDERWADAARWHRLAADEATDPTTAALALGMHMVALDRAGDARAARQAATEYLEKHPAGAHAAQARALARRRR